VNLFRLDWILFAPTVFDLLFDYVDVDSIITISATLTVTLSVLNNTRYVNVWRICSLDPI